MGAGGSWVIARLQLEPAVAAQLLDAQRFPAMCSTLGKSRIRNHQNLGMAILFFLKFDLWNMLDMILMVFVPHRAWIYKVDIRILADCSLDSP